VRVPSVHQLAGLSLFAGVLCCPSPSLADDVIVVTLDGPGSTAPARGVVAFGRSYAVALSADASSSHQGDSRFCGSIAGPSLDHGNQESCTPAGACDGERTYGALAVPDSIAQAMRALSVVSDLMFQTANDVAAANDTANPRSTWRVRAAYANGGPGLVAFGRF
jgi:hypothetical protein